MGEGMALAKGLVLLGVEGLSFQVDLAYLRTKKVRSHEAGENGRGPFPSCLIIRQSDGSGVRNGGHWALGKEVLTAQTKHVSCQLKPSASRKRSPASILKSQPRHFVPNIFS